MLWPRLSPERSCVCCRSRRRLGRLRARPASHCNLDRVVFRYERTEKPPFGGLFLLRNGHRPVRKSCLSGLFPGARTDQDGPQWVKCGRQMRPWTDFAPSPANPVGPLPIGRPRPWSARSAIRRHQPSRLAQKAVVPPTPRRYRSEAWAKPGSPEPALPSGNNGLLRAGDRICSVQIVRRNLRPGAGARNF
jgi:hypothetical protein